MTLPDPQRVEALIREVAQAEILPRFRSLQAADIREKAPGDFVTAADLAAEAALTRRLPELLPGAAVLGEEAVAADTSLYGLFDGAAPVWVIDPVDGTINFAKGRPGFAVIVALVHGGVVQAGWIHDPLADLTVSAQRGAGAWCAGQRLRVTAGRPLAALSGAAYGKVGSDQRSADRLAASGRVGPVSNRMSSGIDYIAVARGEADFFIASRSLPWDHAAGCLITEETGAVASFFDGRAYDPKVIDAAILVAPDRAAWQAIAAILSDPPRSIISS